MGNSPDSPLDDTDAGAPVVVSSEVAPAALTNISWLWDLTSGVTTGAGRVTQLDDQVGSEDLTPATTGPTYNASDATLGGRPSMSFATADSSDMRNVGSTISGPVCWFGVLYLDAVTGYLFGHGGANMFIRLEATPAAFLACHSGFTFGVEITGGWTPAVDTPYLIVVNADGTSTEMFVNGTQVTVDASGMSDLGFSGVAVGSDFGSYSDSTFTASGVLSAPMGESDRAGLLAWSQANAGVA